MAPPGGTFQCAYEGTYHVTQLTEECGAGGRAQRPQQLKQLRAHNCGPAPEVCRHLLGAIFHSTINGPRLPSRGVSQTLAPAYVQLLQLPLGNSAGTLAGYASRGILSQLPTLISARREPDP